MNWSKYIQETIKYLLRSYPVIYPYVKKVEALYGMEQHALHRRNEIRFLELFQLAYDKSPFYSKLYAEAGIKKPDIKSLQDIEKLPIVTKDMVRNNAELFLTVPKSCVVAAHTSGTTGTPLTVYENWPAIWWERAYIYCSRLRAGYRIGDPIVSLRGNLDCGTMSMEVHVSNTLYLSSYCISQDTVRTYYEKIQKFRPVAIEGYPSSLYSLACFLREADLEVSIPVAFTSSEKLLDYQRTLIETQFNTVVYDNYGMTEKTIFLQEKIDHSGYYELPGYSINEYCTDGEICTSLINTAFPLIRYKSKDMIDIDDSGNIHGIIGRVDDCLICKNGSRVTRVDFIEKGNHIEACQWLQKEIGKLEILIVPGVGFSNEDKDFVVNETLKRVGYENMDIVARIVGTDELRLTRRGKFRLIVNEVEGFNNSSLLV